VDLDFVLRPGEDLPASAYRRLRAAGPVVWSEPLKAWLVTSYESVRTMLGDVSRFTMAGTPVAQALGTEGMLVNDTPQHHVIRAVWAKHVSREAMAARLPELKAFAAGALDVLRPRIEAGEAIDFIPAFRDFVMRFIASSFGVPHDRLDVFRQWSELSADTPAVELPEDSPERQRHFAVREAVYALVHEQVADRKRRYAAGEEPFDLIALMVAAEGRDGITPGIVADNIFNFILGALDTTEKWLGNIIVRLCRDPAQADRLRRDPGLIEPFNEEVMRCDTVAQAIQRRVKGDGVVLAGTAMQAGDAVFALLGAANRDATEFKDPDSFDPDRPVKSHLGFGFGFHHCLGINIARMEARAFAEVLLESWPRLRVAKADYGESWALWGPRALYLERDAG